MFIARVLPVALVFALPACGASGLGKASGGIAIQNSAGFTLHTSRSQPYLTAGDVFTATESGFGGSFSARVTSWNQALAPSPCFTIQRSGSSVFAITEGGLICVGGFNPDIEGITFSDSAGNSTTQFFEPQ
jgi:hypothetical protein